MDLPQARDAERDVVSGLAAMPGNWEKVRHLTPMHFTDLAARAAFEEMARRLSGGELWRDDTAMVPVEWLTMGRLSVSMWNYEAAIREVEAAHVRRAAYLQAVDIVKAAMRGDTEAVESMVANVRLPARGEIGEPFDQVVARLYDMIGQFDRDVVSTGFTALDRGKVLRRREALGLGARPSMGKSQLAFQIGENVARDGGVVVIASLEMAAEEVGMRLAGARCGISPREATGEAEVEAVSTAMASLIGLTNIVVVDRRVTTGDLYGICRKVREDKGRLDLVIGDHIRLFGDEHPEERHRLGSITHNLREIAKDLNVPVMPLIQLSRAVEGRKDPRPGLSDLRDSGEIEENMDGIAFIFRAAYYDKQARSQNGVAEVYAQKNRNGRLWWAQLYFDADHGPRFADMTSGGGAE